jgi:nitroreductase
MDVTQAVHERRAFRSLLPADVSDDLVRDLARHAQLAPSCFNNQPVRFVFVRDPAALEALRPALSGGNRWAHDVSLIVCGRRNPEPSPVLSEKQKAWELERPERLPPERVVSFDRYGKTE